MTPFDGAQIFIAQIEVPRQMVQINGILPHANVHRPLRKIRQRLSADQSHGYGGVVFKTVVTVRFEVAFQSETNSIKVVWTGRRVDVAYEAVRYLEKKKKKHRAESTTNQPINQWRNQSTDREIDLIGGTVNQKLNQSSHESVQ